jgi:hypothetical protein
MAGRIGRILLISGAMVCAPLALRSSQTTAAPAAATKVTHVAGLPGVKNKTKGHLLVNGSNLDFTHEQLKVDVPVNSVEDVVTGNDSQRAVGGALGTLSMFAPYGGGRFLSLFRTKLDTLTIKYRDTDGGLHGAIFTMPVGKAELLKKDLLAMGAHTTVPSEADAAPTTKEQKQ